MPSVILYICLSVRFRSHFKVGQPQGLFFIGCRQTHDSDHRHRTPWTNPRKNPDNLIDKRSFSVLNSPDNPSPSRHIDGLLSNAIDGPNSTYTICCGFVVQQMRNKSITSRQRSQILWICCGLVVQFIFLTGLLTNISVLLAMLDECLIYDWLQHYKKSTTDRTNGVLTLVWSSRLH